MNNRQITPLFPVPFYSATLELPPGTLEQVKNQPYGILATGQMTRNHLLDQPEFSKLAQLIDSEFDNYVNSTFMLTNTARLVRTTSWALRNQPGDQTASHRHSNSILSGVLYLQVANDTGDIVFVNTKDNLTDNGIRWMRQEDNMFNVREYRHRPENNQIIIFPSNLYHGVNVNKSSIDRYSLAFNYHFKGVLDPGSTGELILD